MSDPNWEKIVDVFHEALELAPGERAGFLDAACVGQAKLRAEIESMLAAHEPDQRLLVEDRFMKKSRVEGLDATLPEGARVGVYRVVRLIGQGGMGDVYLAERDDDMYERRVALKLMRPGFHAAELQTRFLQERQILAQFDHANIASLLDGGVGDDGRPFLVMQYVEGLPITDYCEEHELSLRERLALFGSVCQVVHAAHMNLVVHRDLKPANILVTSDATVKLLDFGIAKLLDPELQSATRPMQRIMTPDYAAPEQVRGQPVTTATDVYALGVLLYQLLTGQRPLDFPSTSTSEIERVICDVEPTPPSTKASRHKKAVRGELDNITLMALRKDPSRRYQSALELKNDVDRYLRGVPVRAEKDTFSYRARKFLARNRVAVIIAGGFAFVIIAFLGVALKQSSRVASERDRARAEQEKGKETLDALIALFEQTDASVVPGADTLKVGDFIDQSEGVVAKLSDQPAVQARLYELLGGIQASRSSLTRSDTLLRSALQLYEQNDDLGASLRVRHGLAMLKAHIEGGPAAEPLLRESLEKHRALLGDTHVDVGIAMQDLASVLLQTDPDEAFALLKQAQAIGENLNDAETTNLASAHNHLGIYYRTKGDHTTARENFERSLLLLKKVLGDDHPNVLAVTHNVAATLSALGDWSAAETLQRQLIDARRRVNGPETRGVAQGLEALATNFANQGRWDEALEGYEESLRIFMSIYGQESGHTSNALRNVGSVMARVGRLSEGLALMDSSIAIDRRISGVENHGTAYKSCGRATILYAMGEHDSGIAAARIGLADVDRLVPNDADSYRASARGMLATMLLDQGNAVEAEALMREALALANRRLPDSSLQAAGASCLLAASLTHLGEIEEARVLLEQNYSTVENWGLLSSMQRSQIEHALKKVGLSTN